jgi:hypothetical protein
MRSPARARVSSSRYGTPGADATANPEETPNMEPAAPDTPALAIAICAIIALLLAASAGNRAADYGAGWWEAGIYSTRNFFWQVCATVVAAAGGVSVVESMVVGLVVGFAHRHGAARFVERLMLARQARTAKREAMQKRLLGMREHREARPWRRRG